VGAAFAWLPGPARGEGLLRVELDGAFFPKQETLTGTSSRGGKFQLAAFDALACVFAFRRSVELSPCAGAELAYMQGAGIGVTAPTAGNAIYGGVDGRALLVVRLSRAFALRASLDAIITLARPQFIVSGFQAGIVHEPSGIVGRGALGVEVRF
jgi:hypothetical protein